MDRHFFRVGGAPARASIALNPRNGHIRVYQVDIGKGNPTKVHLNKEPEHPEEKLNLRDENQVT